MIGINLLDDGEDDLDCSSVLPPTLIVGFPYPVPNDAVVGEEDEDLGGAQD